MDASKEFKYFNVFLFVFILHYSAFNVHVFQEQMYFFNEIHDIAKSIR